MVERQPQGLADLKARYALISSKIERARELFAAIKEDRVPWTVDNAPRLKGLLERHDPKYLRVMSGRLPGVSRRIKALEAKIEEERLIGKVQAWQARLRQYQDVLSQIELYKKTPKSALQRLREEMELLQNQKDPELQQGLKLAEQRAREEADRKADRAVKLAASRLSQGPVGSRESRRGKPMPSDFERLRLPGGEGVVLVGKTRNLVRILLSGSETAAIPIPEIISRLYGEELAGAEITQVEARKRFKKVLAGTRVLLKNKGVEIKSKALANSQVPGKGYYLEVIPGFVSPLVLAGEQLPVIQIDKQTRLVTLRWGGITRSQSLVGPAMWACLMELAHSPTEAIDQSEISRVAWRNGYRGRHSTAGNIVRVLRRSLELGDFRQPQVILTVGWGRRAQYLLNARVEFI